MEKKIRVLDFIEEHEEEWAQACEEIRKNVYGGLEDLANYRLTNDGGVFISELVTEKARSFIGDDWSLSVADKRPMGLHLMKSRAKFVNVLNTAMRLVDFKLGLKEILDS